jgi:hypothetical protein
MDFGRFRHRLATSYTMNMEAHNDKKAEILGAIANSLYCQSDALFTSTFARNRDIFFAYLN